MSVKAPPECDALCPILTSRDQWRAKKEFYQYSPEELAEFSETFLRNREIVMDSFLRGTQLPEGSYPLRLKIHPSDRCNLRCTMCYLDLESGAENRWYFGALMPELIERLEEILIFGGEPLFDRTSRRFLFSTDKPRQLHTSFLTNGTLVTDRTVAKLEGTRIGFIEVSLDAADAATYGRIRLRGDFGDAVAGARRLAELGRRHGVRRFSVTASCTVQEENYRSLAEFVELCSELGTHVQLFLLDGVNENARRRAEAQGTAIARTPKDLDELERQIDRALACAVDLQAPGAAAALMRVRASAERIRSRPHRLAVVS
jgi:MoaA/NifB/PqqE/SkfB family radical SAM enzyme